MNRIFKVTLPLAGSAEVQTGVVQRWLGVGFQDLNVVVWIETDGGTERTRFVVAVTGEAVPEDADHVGSAQLSHDSGHYVVHVYRRRS